MIDEYRAKLYCKENISKMPRKNISVKSDEVKEQQIVELLKILIKNSEEIKEILLQLKNRFI